MNGIAALFQTDKQAESEGVWFQMEDTPMEFRIARSGNARHEAAIAAKKQGIRMSRGIRANRDVELSEQDVAEIMAETILLDWRHVDDGSGNELPYSREEAARALMMKDFFYWVALRAADQQQYRVQTIAERAELLGKGSSGK